MSAKRTDDYHQDLCRHRTVSLAERLPFPLYADADLGMPLDLILLNAFDDNHSPTAPVYELDPADAELLTPPVAEGAAARARAGAVTWLRRTEYIASDLGRTSSRTAATAPRGRTPAVPTSTTDISRRGQIATIDRTFEWAAGLGAEGLDTWRHPTRPGVHAVASYPVLPNTAAWESTFSYCTFDTAPALETTQDADDLVLLRPTPSGTEPQGYYIAAYVPDEVSAASLRKRRRTGESAGPSDSEPLYFRHGRDFTCEKQVFPDLTQLDFALGSDGTALYVPVSSRLALRKKRAARRRTSAYGSHRDELEDAIAPAALEVSFEPNTGDATS
ncbi:hypothetical protein IWQ60_011183 [Tieghemiomyces parasiticus]|uniref:Uncharacterized protein n=1 Tax=Tieghemiomyces parasiticus TaxID=78921 RepID=A0A9W7ZNI7_9FUNG|nr:hypothetical protein IWQ60_011183 [Tieghemiomyces parasiticus]